MRRHSIGEWWESHSHSAFFSSLGTPQWKGVFISSVCVKRGGYEIKMYICVEKREREKEKQTMYNNGIIMDHEEYFQLLFKSVSTAAASTASSPT